MVIDNDTSSKAWIHNHLYSQTKKLHRLFFVTSSMLYQKHRHATKNRVDSKEEARNQEKKCRNSRTLDIHLISFSAKRSSERSDEDTKDEAEKEEITVYIGVTKNIHERVTGESN
jgi:hypothetical protein